MGMFRIGENNTLTVHRFVHSEEKILDHLLNKFYVNGVSFGEQNLYVCYQNAIWPESM